MSNATTAYTYLTGQGLSSGAATGVVGNLVAESGVNPSSVQSGGPGRGIAQWSAGGRWNTFLSWASARGLSTTSLQTQLAFMVSEMKSMGVWQQLLSTTDATSAAAITMRSYEMPADQSQSNAVRRANLGISAVKGAAAGTAGAQDAALGLGLPSDCLIGIPGYTLPSVLGLGGQTVGGACLLTNRQGQQLLGGILLAAGTSIGIVGLLILAAYGFRASGAQRATGQSLQAVGAATSLVAPGAGATIAGAGTAVRAGAARRPPARERMAKPAPRKTSEKKSPEGGTEK